MAKKRSDLHKVLVKLLGSDNVYFQPPESVKLTYPCIIYTRSSGEPMFANDGEYLYDKSYTATYITRDPDDDMIDRMRTIPMCSFDRFYYGDNLNHYAFTIYY